MTWHAPSPTNRGPLTLDSFTTCLLPPILFYYATAVLVLLPNTIIPRLTILPWTLWLAFRAATTLDLALRFNDARLVYLNFGLDLVMFTAGMRAITWTFCSEPLKREWTASDTPNSIQKQLQPRSIKTIFMDALDLSFNLRGIGWNWSKGLQVAPETRPTHSRSAFVLSTFWSAILHLLGTDTLQYLVQSFSPSIGSTQGGSIFDTSLPPFNRYLHSSTIALLTGLVVYDTIQGCYDVLTIIGVLIFRQHPSQWPPIFGTPWRCTSLTDFWSKGWHQVFRASFVALGATPLSFLFGRVGSVIGAFLVSGILHDCAMWGMGQGTEFQSVTVFFLAMGGGIILEVMWKRVSGYKVGGWFGLIWTLAWVVGWSNLLVDAWLRRGLAASLFLADSWRPAKYFVEHIFTH